MSDDTVLARLATLQTMPIAELKAQWRSLFGTEPPPFNRPRGRGLTFCVLANLSLKGLQESCSE